MKGRRTAGAGKSYPRHHRIASLMQRELAPLVAGIGGDAMVTVRRVALNGDFSVATVYYTMLTSDTAEIQNRLADQAPQCRKQLANKLNMRATPTLVFALDSEGEIADNIRRFLDDVRTGD